MKHLFCSFEIALKLKELGFDEECLAFSSGVDKKIRFYYEEYDKICNTNYGTISNSRIDTEYIFEENEDESIVESVAIPLWQQCISFLKERHVLIAERWDGWEYGAYEWDEFIFTVTKEQAILKAISLLQSRP